jgi:Zn-dependent M28 family amino/carboxypeptidase
MLELAEHYAKIGGPSGRSIIFVAFTAEESGLIGSARFVEHPPVALDKIAYMLNLDMVGRVRNNVLSVGGTGTAPSFESILKQADDASPLELKNFGKGGFGPSDHMSFALKKIPVLFFWSGVHSDYHRPTDDADKINYAGIEQIVQLSTHVIDALEVHAREQYVAVADHSGMSPGGRGGSRVTLGVVPDYGNDAERGVRISGTVPGSPAEAAGLKSGDVIVQFGTEAIDSLYGLTDVLAKAKPGDKVNLGIIRDGKTVELEATLAERKG